MKQIFSQARLYAILARKAPFAVIFRRGPSNKVLLIGWDTAKDSFQPGQWLKGQNLRAALRFVA